MAKKRFYSQFTSQEFDRRLGDVDKKAGLFYYDPTNNRYLVFTNEAARDEYLEDPTKIDLIIGTFDAPFNYSAKIVLESKSYNAVALGSTGHYLDFTFDIENKNGQSTGENVICTYTFRKGSIRQTVTEQYAAGRNVHFNIDKYLSEGTNTITIAIQGVTTLAATTVSVTYQMVNLNISTRYDISTVYNLSTGAKTMEVPFGVSGYGTKVVEWYIDGILQPFVKDEDEVVDSEVERTKYIILNNLSQGKHSLQIRAYTIVNGELFYTDTLYKDIIVYTGQDTNPILAMSVTIPKERGILGENDSVAIYNMVQYVPYIIEFASYSPLNLSSIDVEILLDEESKGTVQTSNGVVNTFSIVSKTSGDKRLVLRTGNVTYTVPVAVQVTNMKLQEITNNLVLAFDAIGRSNKSADKDKWNYGEYKGTLNGFNWNNTSGWVNDRLEMNAGSSFGINFAPLADNSNGKTIEIEWSTKNVTNDDAIICDLRENNVGICIYATKVSLTSADGVTIETEYKSDENVRIAFVINRSYDTVNKGLSFIFSNGIVSRSDNWSASDNYISNKEIYFEATEEVEISLKAIRVYNTALTNDQLLNNFNLYRDTVKEMTDVYDRNDVYMEGTSTFDPEKMMGRLPVMIVTGDIPTLENTSDKDTQIVVDIEYINMQDRSLSFTMKNAAMRPQGTSSMGYPKKNFRIYTEKVYNTQLFDADGKEVVNKLYAFKKGSQPVNCWCLKADYAESSGTHNTGIARLWNEALFNAQIQYVNCLGEVTDGYALRTKAQQIALESGYPYDVRTTIDGFPILLFYRPSANDNLIFIGKYNFNNDKSTESVFGFKGIPNFDNSKMQCWEILNNGNALALFNTIEGFDKNWGEAYESRYPDTKTPYTGDLKAFSQWMTTVKQNAFRTEKWAHLDVFKVAAYYCYLMRFGAVDQPVKNAMFTSEDGVHFYFILYDNDTINGLINTGRLKIKPTDDRQTIDEAGAYVFAGHDSRLWNMLEADEEFMQIVSVVDNALYSAGISYLNTIKMFDEEQADKWVERVYNQDAQYKYISPYVEKGIDNLFMLQGKRDLHRKWWLSKRFAIYDAKYVSGTYKSQAVEIKCINGTQAGQQFTVTSGYPLSYGYGINNLPRKFGIDLQIGESYTFTTEEVVNLGDPVRIYGAPNIAELDFSKMSDRLAVITIANVYDEAQGTKLKKLVVGGKENNEVTEISGLDVATSLEYIDVAGMKKMVALNLGNHPYIKTVKAQRSGIASVTFAKGAPVTTFEIPSAMRVLTLEQLPYLTTSGLFFEDLTSLTGFSIKSCPQLCNDYSLIKYWMENKTTEDGRCTMVMDNVEWSNVDVVDFMRLCNIKKDGGILDLKGRISIPNATIDAIYSIKDLFGETVFYPNAELYIEVPTIIEIKSKEDYVLEGGSIQFEHEIYPVHEGTFTYSIVNGRQGCSINSKSGLLSTSETAEDTSTIVVRVTFVSNDGKINIYADKSVEVVRRTYPSGITIHGNGNLLENLYFTWSYTNEGVNGEYSVEWLIGGNIASYYTIDATGNEWCQLIKASSVPETKEGTLTINVRRNFDNAIVATNFIELSHVIVWPKDATIIGSTNPLEKPYVYTWETTTEDVNGEFYAEWILSGDVTSVVEIASYDNESCTMKMLDAVTELVDGLLTLNIRKSYDRTLVVSATKELQALLEGVIMTSKTNPMIQAVLYSNGLVANEAYTLKEEAAIITASQLKNVMIGIPSNSRNKVTQFDEFQHFTGVTEIISYTFYDFFNLSSTIIPSSVTKIGSYNFGSLETVKIPSSVITIDSNAFLSNTKLTKVEFSEGLIDIASYAFSNCSNLSSVNFPSTLKTISDYAFSYCKSLSSIKGGSGLTFVGSFAFTGISELATIEDTFPYSLVIQNNGMILKVDYQQQLNYGQILAYKFGLYTVNTLDGAFYTDKTSTKEITLQYTGHIQNLTDFLRIGYLTIQIFSNMEEATFNVSYTNVENENVFVTLGVGEHVLPIKINSTVTCTPTEDYDGFTTPLTKSESAGAKIGFDMLYKELLGVYIQHIDGTLYTKEDWSNEGFSKDLANGVAIVGTITGEGFVVGKEDLNTKNKYRWYYGGPSLIEGILATTSSAVAVSDMKGFQNTALLTGYHQVASECKKYIFPNGNKGYLPALGELHIVYQNLDAIEDLMKIIRGSVFGTDQYWSSTQYDDKDVWLYDMHTSYVKYTITRGSKNNDDRETRPFTTIYKQ